MSRFECFLAGCGRFRGIRELLDALDRDPMRGPGRVEVWAVVADGQVGAGATTRIGTAVRDAGGVVTFEDLEPAEEGSTDGDVHH